MFGVNGQRLDAEHLRNKEGVPLQFSIKRNCSTLLINFWCYQQPNAVPFNGQQFCCSAKIALKINPYDP